MRNVWVLLLLLGSLSISAAAQIADSSRYLLDIKKELAVEWPKNKTINLVFHGHSVPAGFWNNHQVHTLESYPHLVLKALKERYPYAVINVIVTATGGENSIKGQTRFEKEVLVHRPDVLFIDYALNDRFAGLERSGVALQQMIAAAQARQIKVILVTPSPDQRIDISDPSNPLDPFAGQIRDLARQNGTGLADPYKKFQEVVKKGNLKAVMSSVNHPNAAGHALIAAELGKYFY